MSQEALIQPVKVSNFASGFSFFAKDQNGVSRSLAENDIVYPSETVKVSGSYVWYTTLCHLWGKTNSAWQDDLILYPGQLYSGNSYWIVSASGTEVTYGVGLTGTAGTW